MSFYYSIRRTISIRCSKSQVYSKFEYLIVWFKIESREYYESVEWKSTGMNLEDINFQYENAKQMLMNIFENTNWSASNEVPKDLNNYVNNIVVK